MKLFRKAMLAVITMVLAVVAIVVPANRTTEVEAANVNGGQKLYLVTDSNWTDANARFATYFFNDTTNKWVDMKKITSKVYEVTAPAGTWTKFIFCRMNPSATSNNWDNRWNQTGNLTYDGTNNAFVRDSGWSETGTWKKLSPGLIGSFGTSSWSTETELTYTNNVYQATVDLKAGDEFKVRFVDDWAYALDATYTSVIGDSAKAYTDDAGGNDHNFKVVKDGKYRIYIDESFNLNMDYIPAATIGLQTGVNNKEEKALRVIAQLDLEKTDLDYFVNDVVIKVYFDNKYYSHPVTKLYSTVNPMNGEEVLTGAYYAVLTLTNVSVGSYSAEVLFDGTVVATSAVATIA